MTSRAKTHRASAQRRRDALLQAAAELAAEVGAGAVTHRAVAARAGVPLSTTSYFFSSIDELVTEALRTGVSDRPSDIRTFERTVAAKVAGSIAAAPDEPSAPTVTADDVVAAVTDHMLSRPRTAEAGLIELYLAAGRDPSLHEDASEAVRLVVERIGAQLRLADSPRADEAALAMSALTDGAMLQRVAGIDLDHRDRLAAGLRLLTAAAMLRDEEIDGLLDRYSSSLAAAQVRERAERAAARERADAAPADPAPTPAPANPAPTPA